MAYRRNLASVRRFKVHHTYRARLDPCAFALPGLKEGETAPIFAGGSNVAIAFKSDAQEKAKAALEIMLSSGYQELLAAQGLVPGIKSAASALPDTESAKAQAAALANSKFTPASPNWGEVEAAQIIPDALVRIAPFRDDCHLPVLAGRGPLGGSILSHDQVEAALMRRAGYEVRVLPVEGGSWEENPPTIMDFVRRDLRGR